MLGESASARWLPLSACGSAMAVILCVAAAGISAGAAGSEAMGPPTGVAAAVDRERQRLMPLTPSYEAPAPPGAAAAGEPRPTQVTADRPPPAKVVAHGLAY